jgi:hypothetical protein
MGGDAFLLSDGVGRGLESERSPFSHENVAFDLPEAYRRTDSHLSLKRMTEVMVKKTPTILNGVKVSL